MDKNIKNLKVADINNVGKGMEIATVCVVAKNMAEARVIFSEETDLEFATVHTAYFEHASSGEVGARISFDGIDDEIWASDVENVKTFVLIA